MRPAVVILAGGQGRRLGGVDKALLPFRGHTLLAEVLARVRPQTDACAISANGNPARFAETGLPVLPDPVPNLPGPLAGILAGMLWAPTADIVTVAVDTPFVPTDLVARLTAGRGDAAVVQAAAGGRIHPVTALWPVAMAAVLRAALMAGEHRVRDVAGRTKVAQVAFPADGFLNINTPADLTAARRLAASRGDMAPPAPSECIMTPAMKNGR